MRLSGLWVNGFRNFPEAFWELHPGHNLMVADNGSGKSNWIEAVSLLATGESWRARQTDELIGWQSEIARLKTKIIEDTLDVHEREVLLTHGEVGGKRTAKRLYRKNGVAKRLDAFREDFSVILFTPEDMEVFREGPSARRRLLDTILGTVFPTYRRSRKMYEDALRRRNRLILQLRESTVTRADFFYWDQLLIEHGEVLHSHRQQFLTWLQQQPGFHEGYQTHYDHSVMSEARLHQYAQAEVGAGHTLVGPHKDDWSILLQRGGAWRDMGTYGSRGEQRLALVWWKLGELAYVRQHHAQQPVVLLDDVFSELDMRNSQYLLDGLPDVQTLITSATDEIVERLQFPHTQIPLQSVGVSALQ